MKDKPRVTVLMPVYNVEQYVKEAIESILNQTFKDFILLILDDCSSDGTADVVRSFTDSRIRYFRQEKNVGLAENLNTGVQLAQTEYLARMDGDDISVNTCLEEQIRFLDTHSEIGLCSVGFRFFGVKNTTVIFPERNEDIMAEQLFGCSVIQPMFRRKIFVDNKLRYRTEAFPAEDYMMWAEFLRVSKAHTLQEVLFHYRTHAQQISTDKRQAQIIKSNEVRLYMLDRLNSDFSDEEKRYFISVFVPGRIEGKKVWEQFKHFAQLVESRNTEHKFGSRALHKRLKRHIKTSAYYSSVELFFKNGYSVSTYFSYLCSGFICSVSAKLNLKILAKCVLNKKM